MLDGLRYYRPVRSNVISWKKLLAGLKTASQDSLLSRSVRMKNTFFTTWYSNLLRTRTCIKFFILFDRQHAYIDKLCVFFFTRQRWLLTRNNKIHYYEKSLISKNFSYCMMKNSKMEALYVVSISLLTSNSVVRFAKKAMNARLADE